MPSGMVVLNVVSDQVDIYSITSLLFFLVDISEAWHVS